MKPKLTKQPAQRRRRHLSFNPDSQFIADAVQEFLKNGGKIKQLENQPDATDPDSWPNFDDNKEADEFLKEC